MSVSQRPISDLHVTVKSREVQRAMLAEMRGDKEGAIKHFLAAAHLELVLAGDFESAGNQALALRSYLSAISCFWRAGQQERAANLSEEVSNRNPSSTSEIEEVLADLKASYPS